MYLITSKDDGVHIFQCDLDGSNRESKMLLMKDEMEKGNAVGTDTVLFNGDELYYTAAYQEPGDASGKKKDSIKALRRVDLNSWTEQEICRSVENKYSIVGAEAGGVLILERPDPFVITHIDLDKISDEEKQQGVEILTKEETEKWPVTVFYWDKKTSNKLTIYESNFADTDYVPLVDGNYLYRIGIPDGSSASGLEKMDMRTGQSEWLWKEKLGSGSTVRDCWEYNNRIYLSTAKNDDTYSEEIYTKDGFQQVVLPSLGMHDSVLFEDEHGYVVWKSIEYRPNNSSGDIVDFIFISREEADKEDPEYTLLYSMGRD